jgi:hypothetical protein
VSAVPEILNGLSPVQARGMIEAALDQFDAEGVSDALFLPSVGRAWLTLREHDTGKFYACLSVLPTPLQTAITRMLGDLIAAAKRRPPTLEEPAYADFATLDSDPPPARRWIVPDWIPAGSVTALFGAGGIGKSLLAQQLATAVRNGVSMLSVAIPADGPVLGYFTEDDNDELRRRQRAILRSMGRSAAYSVDGLRLQGRAGLDNALLAFDHDRLPIPTAFRALVERECDRLRPVLLILDNLAQMFAGVENDRFQVTAFCNTLTGLARRFEMAVLLLGHPAKAEGSQFSGSTAWDAAVRSRLWLERRDDGTLELHRAKSNYAGLGSVLLEYVEGAFVEVSARESGGLAEPVVLRGLATLTARQVATSQNPRATTYLPRMLRAEGLLEDTTVEQCAAALRRLLDVGTVIVGAELGWKKADRHPATGLKVAR